LVHKGINSNINNKIEKKGTWEKKRKERKKEKKTVPVNV